MNVPKEIGILGPVIVCCGLGVEYPTPGQDTGCPSCGTIFTVSPPPAKFSPEEESS